MIIRRLISVGLLVIGVLWMINHWGSDDFAVAALFVSLSILLNTENR